jgi:hypothetical protein
MRTLLAGITFAAASVFAQSSNANSVLLKQQALRKGVEAMPLIKNAKNSPQKQINESLKEINTSLRSSLAECDEDYSKFARLEGLEELAQGEWTRAVVVTMKGPRYLSLLI